MDTARATRAATLRARARVLAGAVALALLVCVVVGACVLFSVVPTLARALPTRLASAAGGGGAHAACNPVCSTDAERCDTATATCSLGCGDLATLADGSVAFNTTCVNGFQGTLCLRAPPLGTGTAFLLQSAAPSASGGSLALTAVGGGGGSGSGCTAPTFELQPTDLLNKAQYFTALNLSASLCTNAVPTSTCCGPDVCPCACCMDDVPNFKPGDWGTDPTPFACSSGVAATGIAGCGARGAKVPCKSTFLVLATADDNPAGGGWVLQAAPTLLAGSRPAPLCAVPMGAAAWRELPGTQAHLSIMPRNCAAPSQGFFVADTNFDRCEPSRSVQLVATDDGAPAWAPVACNSVLFQPAAPRTTWYVLPVRTSPQYWATNACEHGVAQTCPHLFKSDKDPLRQGYGALDPCTLAPNPQAPAQPHTCVPYPPPPPPPTSGPS